MDTDKIIAHTRNWILDVVVAYNLCPFAKRELEAERVRYCVLQTAELESCLAALIAECQLLDSESAVETTLLILANGFSSFDDYLELLEMAESLLEDYEYSGVYQLASFHPEYCLDDVDQHDAANFTNRSPYPILHLIREASIDIAFENLTHPEEIPERNIKLARQMGTEAWQKILRESLKK